MRCVCGVRGGRILAPLLGMLVLAGCVTPKGGSVAEKRAYVRSMHDQTLAEAFALNPELKARIQKAPGYGVFTTMSAKIFTLSTGSGFGVVVDNSTRQPTYMRMAKLGAGLGRGVEKFQAVFVFNTRSAMQRFVEEGWMFGGDASAAAKAEDQGAAAGTKIPVGNEIDVYRFTETGLNLTATVEGTKYWVDRNLNY